MKIGILTQPLHTNYGGLLQAYALQTVLINRGHKVWTIDRRSKDPSLLIKILSIGKRVVLKTLFRKPIVIRAWPTTKEKQQIARHTNQFIKENIRTTETINRSKKLSILNKYQFEAYIVGSDQVWRPEYSPCLENYFLDFLKIENKVKRIAYAASFGVDHWEFSDKQTSQCNLLAKHFNAISVREDSAVKLCNEYLNVDAMHVLDPTMLLTKEDYIRLVEKDRIPKSKGTLMTYILDKAAWKNELVQHIADESKLKPFSVMPKEAFPKAGKKQLEDCIFPPVTEWIRGFMDAEFVVTDSFHGTVFAILFNKQFICMGNKDRGLTRMTSLLDKMELTDRLICEKDQSIKIPELIAIDYNKVNQIIDREKIISIGFLDKALSQNN